MANSNQKSMAHDAREAAKAVVQIQVQGIVDNDIRTVLDPRFLIPITWSGSGFFIKVGNESGYILTNGHVLRNAYQVQVTSLITSEEIFEVEIVGLVKTLEPDIALARLRPQELKRFKKMAKSIPHLILGDSSSIRRGIEVKAIGYPTGMEEPNLSGGEISNFVAGDEELSERLVTSAAINPGNSGGPSIIKGKKVIGLNTSIIVDANNIGFITPINYAKIILKNLLKKESEINLTHLGGAFQKNSAANAQFLGMKKVMGVIIKEIKKAGMLDQIGAKKGDVLLKINDYQLDRHGNAINPKTSRYQNLFDITRLIPLREKVQITLWRGGKSFTKKVMAQEYPWKENYEIPSRPLLSERKFINLGGMIIQELSIEIINALSEVGNLSLSSVLSRLAEKRPSLVVTNITPGGQAASLFFSIGDVINCINEKKVYVLTDVIKILKKANKEKSQDLIIHTQDCKIGHFTFPDGLSNINIEAPPLDQFLGRL